MSWHLLELRIVKDDVLCKSCLAHKVFYEDTENKKLISNLVNWTYFISFISFWVIAVLSAAIYFDCDAVRDIV